ncbi:MAG: class I SAM-dependent methyltransferase [Cytophagaceae bacterium]|jgi:ubiquinone/menaquinone biosynthesis C-methylase UbiE|nr:class I SAM-dependent methyltransferase [Cytophagaceae bacterium]
MEVSESLQQAYSAQYTSAITAWRSLAAKHKANNIVQLASSIKPIKVLEVGCGEGSILKWLSDWNFSTELYGIDISESGIEIVKSKKITHLKDVVHFDGYHIPFDDNYFDLIICSHVMEHVEHERSLLREIQRVAQHQIFEVPIDFSFYVDRKFNHFLGYGHINIYTPALFRFLLKTENFNILKDINYIYDDEVLKCIYKNKSGYLLQKIKNTVLRMFPYLRGIKPNSYAVLTEKSKHEVHIF